MERQYIPPKIYSAKGDLKKRWYVYYSFRNPQTGKMERQAPLTMSINRRFKTVKGRMEQLKILQKATLQALKDGYNPYLVQRNLNKEYHPVNEVLTSALERKSKSVKPSTYRDYKTRINQFILFLENKGIATFDIKKIDRKIIMEFADEILTRSTARNRNNYMTVLSAIFTEIVDHGLIKTDPTLSIKRLKVHSKRDATINASDLETIENYLLKNDWKLLVFVRCVGFLFLRPLEVSRLKIEDINLEEKLITVEIKQKDTKTKIIPDLLFEDLKRLIDNRNTGYLFEYNSVVKTESARRNYYSKHFVRARNILNLPDNYTIYSFRHTYITKVYKELRKEFNQEESLSKLRLITGHTSDAIHKYIHYIDAELPADYSKLLK